MAHITRSIELAQPIGLVSERWTEFERTPRCAVGDAEARVRWRAEVLTFEPAGDGTRVTLRIDYEGAVGETLSRIIEGALEGFRTFVSERLGSWHGATAGACRS